MKQVYEVVGENVELLPKSEISHLICVDQRHCMLKSKQPDIIMSKWHPRKGNLLSLVSCDQLALEVMIITETRFLFWLLY
jgi:hypothetical protein